MHKKAILVGQSLPQRTGHARRHTFGRHHSGCTSCSMGDAPSIRELFQGTGDDEHPPGCRHVGMRVEQCPETFSTMLMGGMEEIARHVRDIERRSDELAAGMSIDMPGMDLCVHSTVLFCEACKRHSVVSWENHRMVHERCRGGACMHPGDYYLSIVCTSPLLRTGLFGTERGSVMSAIPLGEAPYTERDAEVIISDTLSRQWDAMTGEPCEEETAHLGGPAHPSGPAQPGAPTSTSGTKKDTRKKRSSSAHQGVATPTSSSCALGAQWDAMVGAGSDAGSDQEP